MVECNLAKVDVAGSSPVSRSKRTSLRAARAALFVGRESRYLGIEITIFPKCFAVSRECSASRVSSGYAEREIFPEVPPRVEYSLTELGVTFVQPLAVFFEWAQEHQEELIRIRTRNTRRARRMAGAGEP